jgi:hypothetical protein
MTCRIEENKATRIIACLKYLTGHVKLVMLRTSDKIAWWHENASNEIADEVKEWIMVKCKGKESIESMVVGRIVVAWMENKKQG